MPKFVLFCLLLHFTGPSMLGAQPVSARLKVIHAFTKQALPSATVYSSDYSFVGTADENGQILLSGLPSSIRQLIVSSVGFQSDTIVLPIEKDLLILALEPGITSLSEVLVNAASSRGVFHSIGDLDIHLRPITNSQDILRMVPGLLIGQHAGGGKAEQIFLRGFDIDHGTDIRITVDGMPVNMVSHAHGQGYADLHFLIPEMIEHVNFDKGPYFARQGNFATAGYVEFQTRNQLQRSFAKLEGGQFNTLRAVTGINFLSEAQRQKGQSLYAAGEYSFTDGYFDSPQSFNRLNALLKYHGQTSERTYLTASASAFHSKWNVSGQIPDRAVKDGTIGWYGAIDDTEGGSTSRYNLNLSTLRYLSSAATIRNRVYFSRYDFELYSNFTFFLNDPVNGDQIRQKESRDLTGFELDYAWQHSLAGKSASLEAGTQWRHDRTRHTELSRTRNRDELLEPIMLGDITETNAGFYLQEKFQPNKRWSISAGLRADQFWNRYLDRLNGTVGQAQSFLLSPKFSVQYRASEKWQLYWHTGQGLHSNDTRVAVQQDGRRVVTPARGTDIGGIFKPSPRLLLQTTFWYLWLQQEFIYVGDEGVVETGGRTRRMGWDLALRYEIVPKWFWDADISLANPRALGLPKAEAYLPLAPGLTSTGGISYRQNKGWNGSIRYRYMAARPANETNSVRASSYFIIDAAINYTQPKWELGLTVQNMLNSKWKETQFDTESRLQAEPAPVSEIHFTPGSPFFARLGFAYFF